MSALQKDLLENVCRILYTLQLSKLFLSIALLILPLCISEHNGQLPSLLHKPSPYLDFLSYAVYPAQL